MYDLLTTDEFSFRAEVDEYLQVLIHVDVFAWNKSVAKRAKAAAIDIKESLHLEGFSLAYTITPNPKFVNLIMPGESRGKVLFEEDMREVIVWELD